MNPEHQSFVALLEGTVRDGLSRMETDVERYLFERELESPPHRFKPKRAAKRSDVQTDRRVRNVERDVDSMIFRRRKREICIDGLKSNGVAGKETWRQ